MYSITHTNLLQPPMTSATLQNYTPPTPLHPDKPPGRPTPESLISVHFGSVPVRFGSVPVRFGSVSGPFRSVSGPFQVRFSSVLGCWVGSGRGASAREKNITSLGSHATPSWPFFRNRELPANTIQSAPPRHHLSDTSTTLRARGGEP